MANEKKTVIDTVTLPHSVVRELALALIAGGSYKTYRGAMIAAVRQIHEAYTAETWEVAIGNPVKNRENGWDCETSRWLVVEAHAPKDDDIAYRVESREESWPMGLRR